MKLPIKKSSVLDDFAVFLLCELFKAKVLCILVFISNDHHNENHTQLSLSDYLLF